MYRLCSHALPCEKLFGRNTRRRLLQREKNRADGLDGFHGQHAQHREHRQNRQRLGTQARRQNSRQRVGKLNRQRQRCGQLERRRGQGCFRLRRRQGRYHRLRDGRQNQNQRHNFQVDVQRQRCGFHDWQRHAHRQERQGQVDRLHGRKGQISRDNRRCSTLRQQLKQKRYARLKHCCRGRGGSHDGN